MAQLVEHILGKDEVTGSTPVISSTNPQDYSWGLFFIAFILVFVKRSFCQMEKTSFFLFQFKFDLF